MLLSNLIAIGLVFIRTRNKEQIRQTNFWANRCLVDDFGQENMIKRNLGWREEIIASPIRERLHRLCLLCTDSQKTEQCCQATLILIRGFGHISFLLRLARPAWIGKACLQTP